MNNIINRSIASIVLIVCIVNAHATIYKNYTEEEISISDVNTSQPRHVTVPAATPDANGVIKPGVLDEAPMLWGLLNVIAVNGDKVTMGTGDSNDTSMKAQFPVGYSMSGKYRVSRSYQSKIIAIDYAHITPNLQKQISDNKSQLEDTISKYDETIQQLEQKLNELTSAGTIAEAVHNEIKENNMVSEAVAEQLTPAVMTQAIHDNLEQTRLEHANDTSLPIGTFYVQGTEFNHSGYFNVFLAYNNGLLKCSNVGSGQYTVDMSTKNANELVSQIMGAYVTDSKVRVDDAIQLQNNDIGQYCQIKSLTVVK